MAPKSRGGGGSLSRRAAIALIGGGGLLGFSGTGAFSQVDSDRPFSVSTAEDDSSLLKLEGFDQDEVKEPHSVTITNEFNEKMEGKIRIEGNSLEFKSSNTHSSIELEPGEEYEFDIVTPNDEQGSGGSGNGAGSGNSGNGAGSGNSGNGAGSGNSGNGPPCAGEVPGEGLPKCGGNDTIIFEFSGEANEIYAEREITVSHDPSEDTGTDPNTVLASADDIRADDGSKLAFRIENTGTEQATVEQFAVDASDIDSSMEIDESSSSPEFDIERIQQNGYAYRNTGAFDATGTQYDIVNDSNSKDSNSPQYAKINSDTNEAEVEISGFSQEIPELEETNSANEADITVTLVLEDGNKEYFYFKGS